MTASSVLVRYVAVAVLIAWLLAGCGAPTPEPARPAPTIPDSASLFDDIRLVQRPDPFTRDCSRFPAPVLDELGLRIAEFRFAPEGCHFEVPGAPVDVLSVYSNPLAEDEPEGSYFRHLWNGRRSFEADYFRRFILGGKYYAVETNAGTDGTSCQITVQTGAPQPISFIAFPNEERRPEIVRKYGDFLDPKKRDANLEGLARFMSAACPTVERLATGSLAAIDPGGGSLAAP